MAFSFMAICKRGTFSEDKTDIRAIQSYLSGLVFLDKLEVGGRAATVFTGRDNVNEDIADGFDAVIVTVQAAVINPDAHVIFDTGLTKDDVEKFMAYKPNRNPASMAVANAFEYLQIKLGEPTGIYAADNRLIVFTYKGKAKHFEDVTAEYLTPTV